ncbi:MAG: stage III sporulation protein AB [Clostridia bacterium]|nr:stage III sporulation protein AB [Clostridia bacterium]
MTYKLIGALCLVLSGVCASFAVLTKEKEHIKQLSAFAELLQYIYKQIDNFNLPLPKILNSADRKILLLCGARGEDYEITLEKLLKNDKLYLNQKEKELLRAFSEGLGRCYRDEQLKLCKYYSDELSRLCTECREDYPKKQKLTLTVVFCIVLGIIILMI